MTANTIVTTVLMNHSNVSLEVARLDLNRA
jgi:hypothetical protein